MTAPTPDRRPSRWPAGLGGIPTALAALSGRLAALESGYVRMRTATIVSFAGGQASITLDGAQIDGVPYDVHLAPAVGQTVIVLQTRAQLFIIARPA